MNNKQSQLQHKKIESGAENKHEDENNIATVHIRNRKSVPKNAIKTNDSRGFQNPQVQYLYAKSTMQAKEKAESADRNTQSEVISKSNKVIAAKHEGTSLNKDEKNGQRVESIDFKNNRENRVVNVPMGIFINEIDQSNHPVIKSHSKSQKRKRSESKSPNVHRFESKKEENDFITNMKKNFYAVIEENKKLKVELSNSQNKCRDHVTQNETITINNKIDQHRMTMLTEENSDLKKQVEQLKAQLANTRSDLRDKIMSQKDENFLSIENSHLKEENARLFSMLKSTAEYKNFASFADHENRLRYLKDLNFFRHLDYSNNSNGKNDPTSSPSANCHRHIDVEKYLWVPEESFKLLHKISSTENLGLSDTIIDYILFELNKIWKRREEYIISKTHVFCKNCTKPINKRNSDALPVSMSSDTKDRKIAKLENELAQVQSKLSAAQKIIRKNEKGTFNVQENKALAQNLKLIQRSNSEQRALFHKNKFLTEINAILRKQLDEHLLRNFYKLQGWQENGKLTSH